MRLDPRVDGMGKRRYGKAMSFKKDTVGRLIRAHRVMEDLTQAELAAGVGTSQDHISEIERDKHMPRVELLVRIANSVHVHPDTLLSQAGRDCAGR